ncbi:MAG: complexin-2 [Bacteroidaceae bacterium]|nr:complexin-2 [Bacteroidaceae bacterium]
MNREKQIQLPLSLVFAFIQYLESSEGDEKLKSEIWEGIYKKADAMARHDLYSIYKDPTKTEAEREDARQKYLDAIGIPESFRR